MKTKTTRPWGFYEDLYEEINSEFNYKVKILYVEPNKKISLQFHTSRSEYWVVVSGYGTFELDGNITKIIQGDYLHIPVWSQHRITSGINGITIVEVQLGSKCDEDDIIRIEDDYGRV